MAKRLEDTCAPKHEADVKVSGADGQATVWATTCAQRPARTRLAT
jgi:hypothetical protein